MMKLLQLTLFAILLISFGRCDDEDADDKVEVITLVEPPADCQRRVKNLDFLKIHYVGTLTENGKKFDASHDRQQTFDFQMGVGQVIRGYDEGMIGMCVGEKRKLLIPASKGYGARGAGDVIPPNADLTFEVELMDIQDGTPPKNIFKDIDVDSDSRLSLNEVSDYLKKQASDFPDAEQHNEEQHNSMVTEIFSHEDKDKDGFISHEEFSGPKHDEL